MTNKTLYRPLIESTIKIIDSIRKDTDSDGVHNQMLNILSELDHGLRVLDEPKKPTPIYQCKTCQHAKVLHDLVLRPIRDSDKGLIYRCMSAMRWKDGRCLNYKEMIL